MFLAPEALWTLAGGETTGALASEILPALKRRQTEVRVIGIRMAETANLKDFPQTLKLGRIYLGLHENDVAAILGEADCLGGTSRKYPRPVILKYGDIELIFDNQMRQVSSILINFWEDGYPSGGAAIQLDPWIIKGGLLPDELILQLDNEGIDYCEVEPINLGTRQLLVNSAITIIFNNDHDEWEGDAGLRKIVFNRRSEPAPLPDPSPDVVKGSTA